MKITAKVTGDTAVVQRLKKMPNSIMAKVKTAMERLTIGLQRKVMEEKLSGQVLQVRSGLLRNSVDNAVVVQSTSVVGIVSTNVKYARIHEYGGVIHRISKPGVVRLRTNRSGVLLRQGEDPIGHLAVFAKKSHKLVREVPFAGGKSYTIVMPERSFLRSALRESARDVRDGIAAAAKAGAK